jgi:hypothetical protein
VPFPVKFEIPRYKDIEVKKNVYVKVPIYEHIPIYHHFAISREIPRKSKPVEKEEDCEELNKQLDSYLKKNKNLR